MEKRKTSIELMRFLAAVMVVLVHIRQRVYPDNGLAEFAFITVDFFFLLTGFFTMREVSSKETAGIVIEAQDAVLYSLNKARALFGPYLLAEGLMFIIRTAEKDAFLLSDVLKELFHFKWEFLMLHMAGFNHAPAFNVDYLLGPAWFISSLLLALIPFYFLARRFGKTFSGVIAPVSMVMIYASIVQTYETIDVGNQFVFGTMLGNYRAFAGLCTGAFVFHLNDWYTKIPERKRGTVFLRIMDVISWIMAVLLFVFPENVIPNPDMLFWLIPLSVIVLHGFNDFGPISSWLNSHGCTFLAKLGKLSMYVYLFHVQVILLCKHVIVPENSLIGSLLYLALVLCFSALMMAVTKRMRRHSMH